MNLIDHLLSDLLDYRRQVELCLAREMLCEGDAVAVAQRCGIEWQHVDDIDARGVVMGCYCAAEFGDLSMRFRFARVALRTHGRWPSRIWTPAVLRDAAAEKSMAAVVEVLCRELELCRWRVDRARRHERAMRLALRLSPADRWSGVDLIVPRMEGMDAEESGITQNDAGRRQQRQPERPSRPIEQRAAAG